MNQDDDNVEPLNPELTRNGTRASMSTPNGGSHHSIIYTSSTFRTCQPHLLLRCDALRDPIGTCLNKHDMSDHDMGLAIIESEEEPEDHMILESISI